MNLGAKFANFSCMSLSMIVAGNCKVIGEIKNVLLVPHGLLYPICVPAIDNFITLSTNSSNRIGDSKHP
jgi:hypothetical protein